MILLSEHLGIYKKPMNKMLETKPTVICQLIGTFTPSKHINVVMNKKVRILAFLENSNKNLVHYNIATVGNIYNIIHKSICISNLNLGYDTRTELMTPTLQV